MEGSIIIFYKFNCTDPGLQLEDPSPLIGLLLWFCWHFKYFGINYQANLEIFKICAIISLFPQLYKWVPETYFLGGNPAIDKHPVQGRVLSNTPMCFMRQKPCLSCVAAFFGVLFICFIIKQRIKLRKGWTQDKRENDWEGDEGKKVEVSAFFLSFSPPSFFRLTSFLRSSPFSIR